MAWKAQRVKEGMMGQGPGSSKNRRGGCSPWVAIVSGLVIVLCVSTLSDVLRETRAPTMETQFAAGAASLEQPLAVSETAPVTAIAAPVSPQVLFADDFNAGRDPAWEFVFGEWRMVNERLKVIRFVDDAALSLVGNPTWDGYAVDLDVGGFNRHWLHGDQDRVIVYVRHQDPSNTLWFEVSARSAVCGIRLSGEDMVVHQLAEAIEGHGVRHLRIEVRGNCYKFFINMQRVCYFEDDSFPQGRVGLSVEHEADASQIWIDNFRITTLP